MLLHYLPSVQCDSYSIGVSRFMPRLVNRFGPALLLVWVGVLAAAAAPRSPSGQNASSHASSHTASQSQPEVPKSAADLAFESLARDFNNLFESLHNKGGIATEDKPAINS